MEEKKVIKLKFNSKIMIIFTILMIGLIVTLFWKININTNDTSIDFFAVQTHSGFNDVLMNSKYKIINQQELDIFNELYKGFELSNKYDLSNNTIFIQTQVCGSGSISIDFKRVNIDKNVEFKFTSTSPEIGTMDMAYWYLVAIVPNTQLNGVNIDEWKSPIDVKDSLITEYTISIKSESLSLINSLNIIKRELNNIGNIKITKYREVIDNYSNHADNTKYYSLLSYDKECANLLVENINNMDTDLKAELSSAERNIIDYHDFQKSIFNEANISYEIVLHCRNSLGGFDNREQIIDIMKPDELSRANSSNGKLTCIFNNSSVNNFEKTIKTIQQYEEEWNLSYYEISVYWKY